LKRNQKQVTSGIQARIPDTSLRRDRIGLPANARLEPRAASLKAQISWFAPGVVVRQSAWSTKVGGVPMRQRRASLNRATITAASVQAKRRVNHHLELAEKISSDSEKQSRLAACLCPSCHYFSSIGGAAITNRECAGCGTDEIYGSTATDALCMTCAMEHSLCKRCGGDLRMRSQRKDWPETGNPSSE